MTVTGTESMGLVVAWVMFWVAPTWVPALVVPSQVAGAASGPHRKNLSVPLQDAIPVTCRSAESLATTEPVPMDRPPAGMAVVPLDCMGVVTMVAPQRPRLPRAKSLSVASTDCDERVLTRKVEKQVSARPRVVRLRPPSYSSEAWYSLVAPSAFSLKVQGVVSPPGLTMAQAASSVRLGVAHPPVPTWPGSGWPRGCGRR